MTYNKICAFLFIFIFAATQSFQGVPHQRIVTAWNVLIHAMRQLEAGVIRLKDHPFYKEALEGEIDSIVKDPALARSSEGRDVIKHLEEAIKSFK